MKKNTGGTSAAAPDLARSLLVFTGFQGAMTTFLGFGAVMVYAEHGAATTVHYVSWFMTCVMLGMVLPPAWQAWRQRHSPQHQPWSALVWVRCSFALPAVLLPFSVRWPELQAIAAGGFLGMSWGARHQLELGLLQDHARDRYAAKVTAWSVVTSLTTTLVMSMLLTASRNSAQVLYLAYALLAGAGAIGAVRGFPDFPAAALNSLGQVMRQRAYLRCLPLYFLESGLWGIGMVMAASGAVHALGEASVYGWWVSAATLLGAVALLLLRRQRHPGNRMVWMTRACVGMVLAQALLGASAHWPQWSWLFPLHLLVLAAVMPFWQASEQVLNQRAMDLRGELMDRIAVREITLWAFRFSGLWLFWFAFGHWPPSALLALGAAMVASAQVLEWAIARHWLRAPAAGGDQAA